jgi:ferritin-like metal-binding protein YciE
MPEGLRELYIDELKDLYSAENQLVKALPKMAKAASSAELRQGFEKHLKQTQGQVQRLEKIFQALGESPKGKKCKGMEGLIEEGSEAMEEDYEGNVMDAALIGAAQRVEH